MDYIIKLRLMSKISNLINIISRVISNESHSTALKNINEVFREVDLQHIYKQQDPGSQEKLKIAELKKDISLKIQMLLICFLNMLINIHLFMIILKYLVT